MESVVLWLCPLCAAVDRSSHAWDGSWILGREGGKSDVCLRTKKRYDSLFVWIMAKHRMRQHARLNFRNWEICTRFRPFAVPHHRVRDDEYDPL